MIKIHTFSIVLDLRRRSVKFSLSVLGTVIGCRAELELWKSDYMDWRRTFMEDWGPLYAAYKAGSLVANDPCQQSCYSSSDIAWTFEDQDDSTSQRKINFWFTSKNNSSINQYSLQSDFLTAHDIS